MAIRFTDDIDILIADIIAGGFAVQAIKTVQASRGRTIDVHLNNNVVVCWDAYSHFVWAEGPGIHMSRVERYLRKIYEGPRILRSLATWRIRWGLRLKTKNKAAAVWLLRSTSMSARVLRQLIKSFPTISTLRNAINRSVPHQR
jgi:hypothetical protein